MKVNDELYILELPLEFGGATHVMNVSLISDKEHGLTLVDAGLPNQIDLIEQELQKEGFELGDIKQIVLTHQDMDHIGSLQPVQERTGATIYAYVEEVPFIEGTRKSRKTPSPERLAENPWMAEMIKAIKRTRVDHPVMDGEALPFAAGAIAMATPGHTEGHMSLYLPNSKTLITGDALVSDSGTLHGPMEMATPDMPLAMESVKKLASKLDEVETILCYHGGLVTDDASAQLKRVAG